MGFESALARLDQQTQKHFGFGSTYRRTATGVEIPCNMIIDIGESALRGRQPLSGPGGVVNEIPIYATVLKCDVPVWAREDTITVHKGPNQGAYKVLSRAHEDLTSLRLRVVRI